MCVKEIILIARLLSLSLSLIGARLSDNFCLDVWAREGRKEDAEAQTCGSPALLVSLSLRVSTSSRPKAKME